MLIKTIINKIKTEDDVKSISTCFNLYDVTLGNHLKSDIYYFNDIIIHYKHEGDEKRTIENLYLKAKKIKNTLERFIKKLKIKIYKKYEFDKDLRFLPLKNYNDNEKVDIIENKTIYSFRTLDLIHLLKISLCNNENMFPIPLKLKNPYTNLYIKKYNLYNILISFSNTKYILPEIILNYYKSDFDIIKLKLKAYPILKENAINDYVKVGYISDLYDYVISLCHDFRKKTEYVLVKTSLGIFKKTKMVDIFKKCLRFYLKKKYLSNPLKKEYFEDKCIIELKKIIEKYGTEREFLQLNKLESIRYETTELINELNMTETRNNNSILETRNNNSILETQNNNSILETRNNNSILETRNNNSILETRNNANNLENILLQESNNSINDIINNAMNDVSNLNGEQNTIMSPDNFIYRRRSTIYLPPINRRSFEPVNRDPFAPTTEIPRSPNNNNLTHSADIRNRLNFGFN